MNAKCMGLGLMLTVLAGGCFAGMQAQTHEHVEPSLNTEKTFYLKNSQSTQEQLDLVTALRNAVNPDVKIFAAYAQDAIVVVGGPEQMALIQKLVQDLDRPRKLYRLTYTLTDLEGGKRIGVQHFAVAVVAGQRTQMKQGNRVPLVTGTMPVAGATTVANSSQVTYIDVGLTVDATVEAVENGVALKTKVELSSVAGEMASALAQDPVLRQTTLEGTSLLELGKPLELGALDVPGSTRHTQVEVTAELVK